MLNDCSSLKIGIIGCGKVAAEHHLPSLRKTGSTVIGVADCNPDKAAKLAQQFSIPNWYSSVEDLLANQEIQAVGVLTDTPNHYQVALAVLKSGKHLFLEKPLAVSLEECDLLVDASRTANVKSMICFNLRFHRLVRKAKSIIASGRLGAIKAIHSTYTHCRDGRDAPDWHRLLSLGGGVTLNESIHHVDLWHYLTGQVVEEVSSYSNPSEYYEDETSIIAARLSGGTLATMTNTFKTSPNNEIEILGTNGRLQLCLYKADGLTFFPHDAYPGSIPLRLKNSAFSLPLFVMAVQSLFNRGGFGGTFCLAWQHFINSVLSDTQPSISLADGRSAVATTLSATRSANTGRSIQVTTTEKTISITGD